MKVLLINPPYFNHIKSVLPEAVEAERGCNPPLGLLYIAGYVQTYSPPVKIKIIDCLAEQVSYEKLKNEIEIFSPDIVGVTVMSFTLIDSLKVAQLTKKINSKIKVVFGGPHVNIYGRETLMLGKIDYIVLGEGEITFNKLINNLNDEDALKNIPGLLFFDKHNNFVHTGLPSLIKDLDSLPLPARNLIDNNKYSSVLGTSDLVTTMMTSRGCPYKCLFCDRPHLGKIFRARSAGNVITEINDCLQYGIREFLIYDDTFTIDKPRVMEICDKIIGQKLEIAFDIRARVNTIDEEMLKKLKQANCARIHYGVESGTQKILDTLRKGIIIDQVRRIFKMTKAAGIETLAYFMMGNPGETKDDIEETVKFIKELKPDYVHITATMPFPATDLYSMALDKKIINHDVWREFANKPVKEFTPPLWEESLSIKELQNYIKKAYRQFYFRPSYIVKRLLSLKSFNELKIKVRAGLKMLKI